MRNLLWDASALAKRYASEAGTATVRTLFAATTNRHMVCTYPVYVEVAASIRRRANDGRISQTQFVEARRALRQELLLDALVDLLSVSDSDYLHAVAVVDDHNLNSTDAALLVRYLRYTRDEAEDPASCDLVATDRRLLRAAAAEGLRTLNPEMVAPGEVPSVIGV